MDDMERRDALKVIKYDIYHLNRYSSTMIGILSEFL